MVNHGTIAGQGLGWRMINQLTQRRIDLLNMVAFIDLELDKPTQRQSFESASKIVSDLVDHNHATVQTLGTDKCMTLLGITAHAPEVASIKDALLLWQWRDRADTEARNLISEPASATQPPCVATGNLAGGCDLPNAPGPFNYGGAA